MIAKMASNVVLKHWMPLLLLPFFSYLPRSSPEAILIYSGAVLIIFIYAQFSYINSFCIILIFSILSIYEPLLLLCSVVLLKDNIFADNISKFFVIAISIFIVIDIIELPLWTGAIFFWGIPFIICASMLIMLCVRKKSKYSIIVICLFVILSSLGWKVYFAYQDSGYHYRFSNDKNISENFLKNSTSSGRYSESLEQKYSKDDKITIFLFSEPNGTENIIKRNYFVGNFYLYGEHDNFNGFIGENSDFNDYSTQQKSPWSFNRPTMVRNLWGASLRDPFYCSNIGTTIKKTYNLIPITWKYNFLGIPEIIIGKKLYPNKSIYFIGDSDCAVSFLATYNSIFLNALYNQYYINDIFNILLITVIFILFLIKRYKICIYIAIIIPILGFFQFSEDRNTYDVSIKFSGISITTPHVDNSPDKIVNEIAQTGKTVTLGKGDSKNLITVIGSNEHINLETIKKEKNYIFFLLPNSTLSIGQNIYSARDIPLGTVNSNELVILDARPLNINDTDSDSSIYRRENITIIATNSPQRVIDVIKVFK